MRKKWLVVLLVICFLVVFTLVVGCATTEEIKEKDKLVFGAVRPLTGPLSVFEEVAFGPIYKMWVDEVNARGGIYVKEYDKKLPIELKVYDDTSDMGTMTRLLEKLMVEDKVDFLLPPASTAFLYAAAPIANAHGYLLLGAEGGAQELESLMAGLPYFFSVLNYSTHQMPVLVDILKEGGVKTAGIIFIADQHGVEYSAAAVPMLEMNGISVVFCKSVPPGIDDLSGIINEAKAADVDAFLAFVYPDEGFLATGTAIAMGFNPDVFLIGPGGNFEVYQLIFGPAVEGVMSWGAWNAKSSPAAADFVERFIAFNDGPAALDWWGHLPYYAALQVLEQAIEKAGTIDHAVLKDIIATEKFNTILGETWFEHGGIATECYAGQVGQWQNGVFEVIGKKSTANAVIPKPEWPTN